MSSKPAEARASEERWADLIRRTAAGDQSALAGLYDETGRLVHGLALGILKDPGAAEEVTLDVYLQVWRKAPSYEAGRGKPSSWLFTLARSRAIDRLRASARFKGKEDPLDAALQLAAEGPNPQEERSLAERRKKVKDAMARLSPEQREAIGTAYFAGLSHSEIAEKLGTPLGTVKTRIRLGMMRLRELLEPLNEKGL